MNNYFDQVYKFEKGLFLEYYFRNDCNLAATARDLGINYRQARHLKSKFVEKVDENESGLYYGKYD